METKTLLSKIKMTRLRQKLILQSWKHYLLRR